MSSSSSLRIVLVDPLGEVLFSGESLSAREGAPAAAPDSSEAITQRGGCPETLRSPVVSDSGIYRVSRPSHGGVELTTEDDGPVTQDGRAA